MDNAARLNISPLNITYLPLDALHLAPNNARKHPEKQMKALTRCISKYGFVVPIMIDKENVVIAGHGRLEAARSLGIATIPTIRLDHLTPAEVKALRIADNKLIELAEWDTEALKLELQGLSEIGFDLTLTGFEMPELDIILNPAGSEAQEEILPPAEGPAITLPGDLWVLGTHRLFCGDALKAESYKTLMAEEKADLVFTDPPYNVPINGHVLTDNKHGHGEFAMASGEMSDAEFQNFLGQAITQLRHHTTQSSIHYICMDWRHIFHLLAAGQAYDELKNICIWNKQNGGMGSLYRSKHEMICVFKNGKDPHINNVELGKHGRYRTNVWDYAGQSSLHAKRDQELAMHPTPKSVEMIMDAILDCSNRDHLVLDPFGGSGSTLIAAEKTHRRARLMELEPQYVDVTIRRWERLTKQKATLAATGQTFDDIVASRQGGAA
jgi:DNA modification methylase